MISERMLKKWRKEALEIKSYLNVKEICKNPDTVYGMLKSANTKILQMTQELLDQHLINK